MVRKPLVEIISLLMLYLSVVLFVSEYVDATYRLLFVSLVSAALFALFAYLHYNGNEYVRAMVCGLFSQLAICGLMGYVFSNPPQEIYGVSLCVMIIYTIEPFGIASFVKDGAAQRNIDGWGLASYLIFGTMSCIIAYQVNAYASALGLLVFGIVTVVYGCMNKKNYLSETGIYMATVATGWYVYLLLSGTNWFVFGHLGFAALLGAALTLRHTPEGRTVRLVLAASVLSLCVGIEALDKGGVYQIVFLIEMLLMLVCGALTHKPWVVRWGAVGVALAVAYFLKSYMWLLLIFLGIILSGFVIWRLLKQKK
jgi:hypothetical protein